MADLAQLAPARNPKGNQKGLKRRCEMSTNTVEEEIPTKYGPVAPVEEWPEPTPRLAKWSGVHPGQRGPTITSPDDVVSYLKSLLGTMNKEVFVTIYLDHRNHLIYSDYQQGTVDHTAVYPREILSTVLAFDATGIIIAHNHPAGSLEPSEGDKQLTRQIITAARAMGITVHDHLIITNESHFSFRQAGLL